MSETTVDAVELADGSAELETATGPPPESAGLDNAR